VDRPNDEQPYSRYTGVYEDQYQNTYHGIRWWHPGLWWLVLRDGELAGRRWEALKAAYQNRRTFIRQRRVALQDQSVVSKAVSGVLTGTPVGADAPWDRYRQERKYELAPGEGVETEIAKMIDKRSEENGERETQEQRAERRYYERRRRLEAEEREANRGGWITWYRHLRAMHERRARELDVLLHELGDERTA
jgi:hypothetical protein